MLRDNWDGKKRSREKCGGRREISGIESCEEGCERKEGRARRWEKARPTGRLEEVWQGREEWRKRMTRKGVWTELRSSEEASEGLRFSTGCSTFTPHCDFLLLRNSKASV